MGNIINKIKVSGTDYNISTTTTSGLTTNADGAVFVNCGDGLTFDNNKKLKVNCGDGLIIKSVKVSEGENKEDEGDDVYEPKLVINTTSGLTTNAAGEVYVNCGDGLTFDNNKKIKIDDKSVFVKYLNKFATNIDSLTSTGIYFGYIWTNIQVEVDCGGGTSGSTSGGTSGSTSGVTSGSTSGVTSGSTSGVTNGSTSSVREECFVVVLTNNTKKTISQLKYGLHEDITLMARRGTYTTKLEDVTWGNWQPLYEFIFF